MRSDFKAFNQLVSFIASAVLPRLPVYAGLSPLELENTHHLW